MLIIGSQVRVLVAEPNSRTRPSSRVFYCLRTLTGTASQVIRQGSPLRGRCLRAFSCAVESWSRSQIREPGHPAWFFIACGLSPGLRPRLFAKAHPSAAALKRVQLRCRVLVAEPNSKTRPSSRVFYCPRIPQCCSLKPSEQHFFVAQMKSGEVRA